VTLQSYKIVWRPPNDVTRTVSLMIDPELVRKAMSDGRGVKETPSKLELCRRVRNAAAATDSRVRAQPIYYEHLTITPHS